MGAFARGLFDDKDTLDLRAGPGVVPSGTFCLRLVGAAAETPGGPEIVKELVNGMETKRMMMIRLNNRVGCSFLAPNLDSNLK